MAYVKDLAMLEGSSISENVVKSENKTYIFRMLHFLFKVIIQQNNVLL